MIRPDLGKFRINQAFNDSCCRASYAKFGMKGHNGLDLGTPSGTPVVAPISGTLVSGFEAGGYGNYVFITGGGLEVVLGHLSTIEVRSGQVKEGQRVALSGNTGNSTGPHLHFGVRPIPSNRTNGFLGYVDPTPYLTNHPKGETMRKPIPPSEVAQHYANFTHNLVQVKAGDPAAQNRFQDTEADEFWYGLCFQLKDLLGEKIAEVEKLKAATTDPGAVALKTALKEFLK